MNPIQPKKPALRLETCAFRQLCRQVLVRDGWRCLLEPRLGDLSVESNRRTLLTAWYKSLLFTKTGLNAEKIEAEVMSGCHSGGDFLRIVMEAIGRQQGV